MRLAVLGGGPAGLGTAIAVKRALGDVELTVHDRKDPGQDGFGLILSPRTVARHAALGFRWAGEVSGALTSWGELAVQTTGAPVVVGGHPARAVPRSLLVAAMRDEARDLGCTLLDGSEVEDDLPDADWVVDARGARHDAFPLAEVEQGGDDTLYVWYATDRPFPRLTFVLADTGAGVLTAHTYPYQQDRSAFIVEGPAAAWRAVLRERRGTDDVRLRTAVAGAFADALAGHDLIGGATRLRAFRTRKPRRWRTDRTVLIGDAAHSAHFSVGSGTTMALDDALGIAEQLRDAPDPVAGVDRYVAVRGAATARVQELGRRSAAWWRSLPPRCAVLPDPALAWSLVTRTGQGTTATLRGNDPELYRTLVRHAADRAVGFTGPTREVRYPDDPAAADVLATAPRVAVLAPRLDGDTRTALVDLLERTAEPDVLAGAREVVLRVRDGDQDWAESHLLAGRISAVEVAG